MNPSQHKMTVFSQIFKLIPRNLIPKLAKKHGVDKKSRSFSPTSHVLCLVFGQLSHAIGLNDICDTLHNHSGVLTTIRMVEINGKMKRMTFITNNFDWSANSICDLYKAR